MSDAAPWPTLRRVNKQYTQRRWIFAGKWRNATAYHLLEAAARAGVQIVYLVGGWDVAHMPRREWYAAAVAQGWEIKSEFDDHAMAVSYERVADGTKIALRMSSIWFGECEDVDALTMAYRELGDELRRIWADEHVTLLGTPAATGNDLLQRSIPWGKDYPILDDERRGLLMRNSPQGRIQMLTMPGLETIPGFYHLDARWMYAACLGELPGALERDDAINEYAGKYIPAFYEVSATVPDDWRHVGLLPFRVGDQTTYPDAPGASFSTWAGNAEIDLAIAQGWQLTIRRRLIFAKADPCRVWISRLKLLRETTSNPLIAGAIRNMVIGAIGAWHRQSTLVKRITPHGQGHRIKNAVDGKTTATKEGIVWHSRGKLSPVQLAFQHPEWSASVWSRARARLALAALQLPRESLLAFRTDAISATINPDWPDTGKPGAWRPKLAHAGELPAPHDFSAYLALRKQLEHEV